MKYCKWEIFSPDLTFPQVQCPFLEMLVASTR